MTVERDTVVLVELEPNACPEQRGVRSIDKRRIRRMFGRVSPSELASIDQGLELFLGISGTE